MLTGDVSCDVCIVGGGYTGLSAALHLAQRGCKTVLLEAERIGWGASGRNGGQLGTAQVSTQPDLVATHGAAAAHQLWDMADTAKDLVIRLIHDHAIACDFTLGHIGCAVTQTDFDKLKRHVDHVSQHYAYPHYTVLDRAQTAALSGTQAYVGAQFVSEPLPPLKPSKP
jgi:gamma-glutamylputrescine oxidase